MLETLVTHGLRAACVLYILELWAGVLPTRAWPLDRFHSVRMLRLDARRALGAIALTPGDEIFTGSPDEWKVAANCLDVSGETLTGRTLPVYRHDCPDRPGLRLHNPPFDQVLQEMTRITIIPPLAPGSGPANRVRDIAEYFCHSPLETHPPFRRVFVRQVIHVQSASSGVRVRNSALHCTMSCGIGFALAPSCEFRGQPQPVG